MSRFPIAPKFQTFFFTATAGQKVFTLPSYPTSDGLIGIYINGFAQNSIKGDYVLNGLTLTLSDGVVTTGDIVYGVYMVGAPISAAQSVGFQSFFFTATNGQTQYSLPSLPLNMLSVAINGTAQSQLNGDFSVSGLTLTFNGPQSSGDKVFGVYAKA